MSAAAAPGYTAPGRSRAHAPARRPSVAPVTKPNLTVVRAVAPGKRALPVYALMVVMMLVALVVPMVLNAKMAETAYNMHQAQIELAELQDHNETLRTQVQRASTPEALRSRAAALGMVPAGIPGVVDISRRQVDGGEAAAGTPLPPPPAVSAGAAQDAPAAPAVASDTQTQSADGDAASDSEVSVEAPVVDNAADEVTEETPSENATDQITGSDAHEDSAGSGDSGQ
ncbi:hypothetical protein [Actinomyces vulturis]|uniref:hypothetical protein n=1 Tax=Actinomyces vulturis TaxID=1857645 RepID=UPI00082FBAEF|nr:hypothetical protein [Actinomyces vulturis]